MDTSRSILGKRGNRETQIEEDLQRKKYDLQLLFYNDDDRLITLIPPMKGFQWSEFLRSYFGSNAKS